MQINPRAPDQVDTERQKIFDLLLGQDLRPGSSPRFAGITAIYTPTLRPISSFKIGIRIRKDLFDLIPSDWDRIHENITKTNVDMLNRDPVDIELQNCVSLDTTGLSPSEIRAKIAFNSDVLRRKRQRQVDKRKKKTK